MIYSLNETHDPGARSWVSAANTAGNDFPIQNLPFGVFEDGRVPRIGVAIGDQVLDLAAAADLGCLKNMDPTVQQALRQSTLNSLMALDPQRWSSLRGVIFHLLREGSAKPSDPERLLVPMRSVRMKVPAAIGDYTDFYASIFHATNVGTINRPENPLLPNYKWVPIGYHGRASSIVASGTPVKRPMGQVKPQGADVPYFTQCKWLDYEVEVALYVGPGNRLGEPISIGNAEEHAFGLCLMNDWSARDIMAWEYQPLGPLVSKDFLTTVSPWVVTMEALAPYRVRAFQRASGDPAPLPHLHNEDDQQHGGVDLTLEAYLSTRKMRESGMAPHRLSCGYFRNMYWTFAQLITHHASNGCNLQPGDLLGSGTVSGPSKGERGCLHEITWRGTEPVQLPSGEQRRYLEDGDELNLRGYCERDGAVRIGFGECRGTVEG